MGILLSIHVFPVMPSKVYSYQSFVARQKKNTFIAEVVTQKDRLYQQQYICVDDSLSSHIQNVTSRIVSFNYLWLNLDCILKN